MKMNAVKRGDVYYASLDTVLGSEQGGTRPVLILSNDIGNFYSSTVICAAITSSRTKHNIPTHVKVRNDRNLSKDSIVLLEQIRTIDKTRLKRKITVLNKKRMYQIDRAVQRSLGFSFKLNGDDYEKRRNRK